LVNVVTSVRSPLAVRSLTSFSRSGTWPPAGRMKICGSTSPVGRMICSTTEPPDFSSSYGPGVALTNTTCGQIFSTSSKRSGRLSIALGRRNP